jgi:eukaryotic-like serine/threonine-protein kinase
MAIGSVSALITALRKSQVLDTGKLDDLVEELRDRPLDARAFAIELLKRDLLTPYQANQLFQAGGRDLVLGPYVLLSKLGEGLMGPVYKARHRLMNRLVALKVIRPELLAHAEAVERFYQLTMAAGQLSHPHIVHAYDSGPVGNTHFFAMEFVEGIDLERLVQQSGALQVSTACDYIRQAALGLQHAFELGMLHRDVKPSNLLVTRPGASTSAPGKPGSSGKLSPASLTLLKIRNLGLNLLQPLSEEELAREGAVPQGKVPRTPDYMAPERARAANPGDIRSDLYSLGCTFYFLVAGRVPFPGGTPLEKLRKHQLEEPVPLNLVRAEVTPTVTAIVARLMTKRPENRYATPGELAMGLGRL